MQLDPDYLRDHYRLLPDEELLEIRRSDLVEMAQAIYDAEIEARGLARRNRTAAAKPAPAGPPSADAADDSDWLEDAAEVYSIADLPGRNAGADIEEVRAVLEAAGIPCHVELSETPEDKSSVPAPTHHWRLRVPGHLNLQATSTLERDIANPEFEAQWRTHLEALSDRELLAMHPETVFCGLFDRVERITRAYEEEIARRRIRRP